MQMTVLQQNEIIPQPLEEQEKKIVFIPQPQILQYTLQEPKEKNIATNVLNQWKRYLKTSNNIVSKNYIDGNVKKGLIKKQNKLEQKRNQNNQQLSSLIKSTKSATIDSFKKGLFHTSDGKKNGNSVESIDLYAKKGGSTLYIHQIIINNKINNKIYFEKFYKQTGRHIQFKYPIKRPHFILKDIKNTEIMTDELKNLQTVNDGPLRKIGWIGRSYRHAALKKNLGEKTYLTSLPMITLTEDMNNGSKSGNYDTVLLHAAKGQEVYDFMEHNNKESQDCCFYVGKSIGALHRYFAEDSKKSLYQMKTFCHGDFTYANIYFDKQTKVTYLVDNGNFFHHNNGLRGHICEYSPNFQDRDCYLYSPFYNIQDFFSLKNELKKVPPLSDVLLFMLKSAEVYHESFIQGYVSSFSEEQKNSFVKEIKEAYKFYQLLNMIQKRNLKR
jgi:hypothetical protein